MKVAVDTNVIVSYAVFHGRAVTGVIEDASEHHDLIVPGYVADEFRRIVATKWPKRAAAAEAFLHNPGVNVVPAPASVPEGLFDIRDPNDYPVLYAAVVADADVLVTGDKDFMGIGLPRPEIMTPAEYVEKYAGGPHS